MMPIAATIEMPPAPRSVVETGLSSDLILQIATKTLHIVGEMTGTDLAARLGVPFMVVEPSLESLVVPITAVIIIVLFASQRVGTAAVGRLFGGSPPSAAKADQSMAMAGSHWAAAAWA